jgi:hypothetical protein
VLADGSGRGEQDVKEWGRETPLADAVSRAPAGAALGATRETTADASGRGEQDVKDWGRETPLANAVSRAPAGAALGDTRETTAAAAASADRGSDQAAPIGFFCVRAVQP